MSDADETLIVEPVDGALVPGQAITIRAKTGDFTLPALAPMTWQKSDNGKEWVDAYSTYIRSEEHGGELRIEPYSRQFFNAAAFDTDSFTILIPESIGTYQLNVDDGKYVTVVVE